MPVLPLLHANIVINATLSDINTRSHYISKQSNELLLTHQQTEIAMGE